MDTSLHDARETYCRMLGHDVPFRYCRALNAGLPCRRVADCWYTQFDVTSWLREHFTAEQLDRITAPPSPKIATLVDLINRARSDAGAPPDA